MIELPRRTFLHLAAGAAALHASQGCARAQGYPARPVHIVVGFPPGGANDIHARLIGASLADKLGQPFVVENRPGAAGNLATESVVRAPPDGYTLLLVSTSNAVNAAVYDNPNLNIDVVRDIAPVASLMRNGQVLVVTPAFPANSVGELIAYAMANPGKVNLASSGTGGAAHLSGELFKMMTGIDLTHVPYRGEAPAITDVIGGQVQMIFATTTASIEYIRAGKLRALAVTSAQRSAALPGVATVGETVPGFEVTSWAGIAAPKRTPAEVIDKLNATINEALASDAVKTRYAEMASTLAPGSAAEFGNFIAGEAAKWAKVVRFAGLKPP